jgi:uncharacterized damage-inducible protein DinB
MSHYGGKELAASFRTVRNNTTQIANEIPENQYNFKAAPGTRTVGELLIHIALGHSFQMSMQGQGIDDLSNVDFPALMKQNAISEGKPRNKAEILALLKSEGDAFAHYLEGLSDAFLAEHVKMPPGADPATKTRLEMLLSPKEHEMHHRGQLMLIQRVLGITPHLTRQREERAHGARAAAEAAQPAHR